MVQLHKRYSDEQGAFLFHAYLTGLMRRQEVQETLVSAELGSFAFPTCTGTSLRHFPLRIIGLAPGRITPVAEAAVEQELLRERSLVEDPDLPISGYNHSAVRDRLRKKGITIPVKTIIDRAKKLDCHQPRRTKKVHDREVLTASAGTLIQHVGSTHRWSPLAKAKWTLITSIHDFSRKILFPDFFPAESTWAHIQATQSVVETFGVPLRYYASTLCGCFALSRAATASGASMSSKPTTSIPSGVT